MPVVRSTAVYTQKTSSWDWRGGEKALAVKTRGSEFRASVSVSKTGLWMYLSITPKLRGWGQAGPVRSLVTLVTSLSA